MWESCIQSLGCKEPLEKEMATHSSILLEGASQGALVVKNPPANAGDVSDVGSIPGLRRSLEEGRATHCSIPAWRIP